MSISLTGSVKDYNAQLSWKTFNEINTRSFVLERSTDGIKYIPLYNVAASSNTGVHEYRFTDPRIDALQTRVVYYRLKQVDLNGHFSWSPVVALSPGGKNIVLLYPNPVQDITNLVITADKAQQVQYRIIDPAGRIVVQQKQLLTTGSNHFSIDVSTLPGGLYQLDLKGETINERRTFKK